MRTKRTKIGADQGMTWQQMRFISGLFAATISLTTYSVAWAQDPAAPTAAAQETPQDTTPGDTASASEAGYINVQVIAIDESGNQIPAENVIIRAEGELDRPRFGLTDASGKARLRVLADTYKIVLSSIEFTGEEKTVVVPAGDEVNVSFTVYRRVFEERVRAPFVPLDRNEFSVITRRNRRFIQTMPFQVGDRQSVTKIIASAPGMVVDTLGQIHPRGENSIAAAYYLDGVLMPSFLSGRVSQLFLPDLMQEVAIRTAGLNARYGGGSGAIYDIRLRQPPTNTAADPRILEFRLGDGSFDTGDYSLLLGNSLRPKGRRPRRILETGRYLIGISGHYSLEGREAPQDGSNNPENFTASEVVFGKITFDLNRYRRLSLLGNISTGRAGIATRLGFQPGFKPFGAGFGFLGEKNFDGTQAGQRDNFRNASGQFVNQFPDVPNQEAFRQTYRQTDNNSLLMIQTQSTLRSFNEVSVAFGINTTNQTIRESSDETGRLSQFRRTGNPRFLREGGTALFPLNQLPVDNSIEYLPNNENNYNTLFFQVDFRTPAPRRDAVKTHRLEAGIVYHDISGNDSYRFIPQSQLALNELAAIDPRFTPPRFARRDMIATGRVDSRGNPEYQIVSANPQLPTVFADRTGFYGAAYVQDTITVTNYVRMNVGLRYDTYSMENLITTDNLDYRGLGRNRNTGTKSSLSPRLNIAYVSRYGPRLGGFFRPIDNLLLRHLGYILNEQAILRMSYNRMFAPPGLSQGYVQPFLRGTTRPIETAPGQAIATLAPVPQIVDQYDVSLERVLNDVATARLSFYTKDMKNTLLMRSTLPALQSGMLNTYNLGDGVANGYEFYVEANGRRRNGARVNLFIAYTNSSTKPKNRFQRDNSGTVLRGDVFDFDQQSTTSSGISYTTVMGDTASLSMVFGTGLYSSRLTQLPNPNGAQIPTNRTNPVRVGDRTSYSEINLRLATRPNFLYRTRNGGGLGLEFNVENLLDSEARMNWRGPFAGTRYQIGRRFLISLVGRL